MLDLACPDKQQFEWRNTIINWRIGEVAETVPLDNRINGFIPDEGVFTCELGKVKFYSRLDLSRNQITGEIPSVVGGLIQSLTYLDFSKNLLIGSIPQTLGQLKGLEFLDLSYNSLSGTIPRPLEALQYLKYLNVSFNQLSGEIPSGGLFSNLTAKSFLANKGLCGRPDFGVPPCLSHNTQKSKTPLNRLTYILPVIASTIILPAVIYMLAKNQKRNAEIPRSDTNLMAEEHRFISYNDLCRATNDFCESNSLGVGGFGSMYKGILFDGTTVAIKVLNLQREGGL
ncbi:putative non-specific serine/threonine protein kinase [Rosa chinensis]|uniref:Putative non-specific serine/threonine protein kinase n=1 Tax=Rosa chinensis TaxID=74649 RepID=A0A2P6QTH8_ROSCH|nr:putative non-specific serine/threonine protein kinase [Rosa chinensis]